MVAAPSEGAAVGATEGEKKSGALAALMTSALALPVLALPVRAGAAEVGEVGFTLLGYQERGLIKITEPIAWTRLRLGEDWEVRASALIDIITGASPELVTNVTGQPVRTITGASVSERRKAGDVKVTRRVRDFTFSASRAVSNEEDYHSRAFGLEATLDLDQKLTTLVAAFGKSNDRISSVDDELVGGRRDTKEYLAGLTRVLSPVALVQSTLQWSRGRGFFSDPYKKTFDFPPDGLPVLAPDSRPDKRDMLAWLTRYRHHFPARHGTLQAEYRYFRDDWGVRSHALEAAWEREVSERFALRPALRYYTQSQAFFYSPVLGTPRPELQSSDQRLSAFGGLSPSLRAIWRFESGLAIEATAGYVYNDKGLRPGGGEKTFETLRAYFGIATLSKAF